MTADLHARLVSLVDGSTVEGQVLLAVLNFHSPAIRYAQVTWNTGADPAECVYCKYGEPTRIYENKIYGPLQQATVVTMHEHGFHDSCKYCWNGNGLCDTARLIAEMLGVPTEVNV